MGIRSREFVLLSKHILRLASIAKKEGLAPKCTYVCVALKCLPEVIQTMHCVFVGLACCIAILGGEVVLAYLVLVARISGGPL